MKSALVFIATAMLLLSTAAPALQAASTQPAPKLRRQPLRRSILVNKANNTLRLYVEGQAVRHYRVATGLYRCTPEGRFRVIDKSFISRSGRGQFGTRWLGLNTLGRRGWYRIGIHGTNEPWTIGKYASKACVRMLNQDINEVFDLTPVGTPVRIVNVTERPRAKPPQSPQNPLAAFQLVNRGDSQWLRVTSVFLGSKFHNNLREGRPIQSFGLFDHRAVSSSQHERFFWEARRQEPGKTPFASFWFYASPAVVPPIATRFGAWQFANNTERDRK